MTGLSSICLVDLTRTRAPKLYFAPALLLVCVWVLFGSNELSFKNSESEVVVPKTDPFYNRKSSNTVDVQSAPYIYSCSSGCVKGYFWPQSQSTQMACIGSYDTDGGEKRPWAESNDENLESPVLIKGNVLAVYSPNGNINHALHDDIWSAILWLSKAPYNVTVIIHTNNPWTSGILRLAGNVYNWNVYQAPNASLFCATESMYLNGFIRGIINYERERIKVIANDLRNAVVPSRPTPEREKIVIYSRLDSEWRQLSQVEFVTDLFNQTSYDVEILPTMPKDFDEQARVMSEADLFIAPNGGWAPNVLWMHDSACLVELHLYRVDSWIAMFGLSTIFPEGNFMTVTGDYKDPAKPKIERPGRNGGDDEILGSRVAPDIRNALSKSPQCKRFLKDL